MEVETGSAYRVESQNGVRARGDKGLGLSSSTISTHTASPEEEDEGGKEPCFANGGYFHQVTNVFFPHKEQLEETPRKEYAPERAYSLCSLGTRPSVLAVS